MGANNSTDGGQQGGRGGTPAGPKDHYEGQSKQLLLFSRASYFEAAGSKESFGWDVRC